MPIVNTDIVYLKALVESDASSNGGGPSATQVTNLFPNVNGTERTAGITRYRKVFLTNKQTVGAQGESNLTLYNGKLYLRTISPGGDYFRMCKSPSTIAGFWDTQADASTGTGDYAEWSGVGTLYADVAAATQNFDVVAEAANGFHSSRMICITDGTNREFISCSGVTWVSNTATLSTAGVVNAYARSYFGAGVAGQKTATAGLCSSTTIGTTGANFTVDIYNGKLVRITDGTGVGQVRRVLDTSADTITVTYAWATTPDGTSKYEVIKTYVSEVVEVGDLIARMTPGTWDESGSLGGTYDEIAHPLICYGGGTPVDNWTASWSDATHVTIVGDRSGTVLSNANPASALQPSKNGAYLFKIEPYFVGWSTGAVLSFSTDSAMAPVWIKEVVAASTAPCGDNYWEVMGTGDSA